MKGKARGHGLRARIATFLLRRFAWVVNKVRLVYFIVINRDAVPRKGGLIIACNHISALDPVFLWCVLRRPAIAIAMAELWAKRIVRWVMNLLKHIPVDRKDPASRAKALEDAVLAVRHGGIVIIYPHGRCVRKGENEAQVKFQAGVYEIARQSGAPVLAAHISGTNNMLPLGKDRAKGEKRFVRKAEIRLAFAPTLMQVDEDTTADEFLTELRATINGLAPVNS